MAVALSAAVPYLHSLTGNFLLDDWTLIVDRDRVHSLQNIPWAFHTRFLPSSFGHNLFYYRPLTIVSYQLNYAVAGPHPFQFHLTNLLLQVLTTLLVFWCARRITGNVVIAGLAGLAFAVLPSHAEAVAWISGRTDILAATFLLAGLLVFLANVNRPRGFSWPLAVLCSFLLLCGMFSKEQAVILPALMVGYAWIFGGVRRRDAVRWVIALMPSMLIFMVMRKLVVGADLEKIMGFMLAQRLLGVGIAYAAYLRMLFVPMEPKVIYDVFPVAASYPLLAIAAWLLPIGLVASTVLLRKKAPIVAFGCWWIFLALLPVSNLLPSLGPLPAERFVYMASIGSSLIIGWAAWKMLSWRPKAVTIWPLAATLLVAGYFAYGAALTMSGCRVYETSLGWASAIQASDTRFADLRATAASYFEQAGFIAARSGDPKTARKQYKEAARGYEAALRYDPGDADSRARLAAIRRALAADQPL